MRLRGDIQAQANSYTVQHHEHNFEGRVTALAAGTSLRTLVLATAIAIVLRAEGNFDNLARRPAGRGRLLNGRR